MSKLNAYLKEEIDQILEVTATTLAGAWPIMARTTLEQGCTQLNQAGLLTKRGKPWEVVNLQSFVALRKPLITRFLLSKGFHVSARAPMRRSRKPVDRRTTRYLTISKPKEPKAIQTAPQSLEVLVAIRNDRRLSQSQQMEIISCYLDRIVGRAKATATV